MSDEIYAGLDKQQGTFVAWHKKTEVREVIDLGDNHLTDWDVIKKPLYRSNGQPSTQCEVVCTDRDYIVNPAVNCKSYSLITNADFLELVQDSLKGISGAKVVSIGSLCGRTRIFVSVQVDGANKMIAAGREFENYLNFLSSHDQSAPLVVNASNACTVCNNTFGSNLRHKSKNVNVKVRHTKNAHLRLENIPEVIDGYVGAQAEFRFQMDLLAKKRVNAKPEASAFFAGFLGAGTTKDGQISTRKENQINRLVTLFQSGKGNRGENRSDLFSAITDYYTHESLGPTATALEQEASSFLGDGQKAKARAMSLLVDSDAYDLTIKEGTKILN